MLHHYHKETRVQAVHALIHVVKAYALQFPLFVNGVMGMNVSSTGPLNTIETMQRLLSFPSHGGATMPPRSPPAPTALHPNMIEAYGQMMVEVLGVIRDDPDEAVAANGCATLAEWCSNLGSAAVSNHADAIMKALLLVLKRKTASQRIANDEEEEEAGEDTTRAATALDEADENDDVFKFKAISRTGKSKLVNGEPLVLLDEDIPLSKAKVVRLVELGILEDD
jgi:hypothetical protein